MKLRDFLGDISLLETDQVDISTHTTENVTPNSLSPTKHAHDEDSGLGDDDELQEILARRRRRALLKKTVFRIQDIARSLKEDTVYEEVLFSREECVVFDDTTQFVAGLVLPMVESNVTHNEGSPSQSGFNEMDICEDIKSNNREDRMEVEEQKEIGERRKKVDNHRVTMVDEPIVSQGMAATITSLIKSGELTKNSTGTFSASELTHRNRMLENRRLTQLHADAIRREHKPLDTKAYPHSQNECDREWQNKQRNVKEAYLRMREFENYKFNVKVERSSEWGHEMSEKEAYKELSHRFHGSRSGTMKKGKKLEKVLGMRNVNKRGTSLDELNRVMRWREERKKAGSAHIRLK